MKNVFIIGLGLIGGSIALNIKKHHPFMNVIGFDINEQTRNKARTIKVVDQSVSTIEEGAKQANVIIISTPVQKTIDILYEIRDIPLQKGVIITDVGSTKRYIVEKAREILPHPICFIGGHPMAGSHKSGVEAARSHLFENAFYILTPTNSEEQKQNVQQLMELLKGTKAKFHTMSAEQHDEMAGVISHFPHIVASSLVHQAKKSEENLFDIKMFAAGGFRDITRIASSNPTMWRDILLQNQEVINDLFSKWLLEMERIQRMVQKEDAKGIYEFFSDAKQFRDGLPEKQKGVIPSFHDLYIDVPDNPGVISEITYYLAKEKISITNIRIIETREDIFGVLQITFQTEYDCIQGKDCIEKHTPYQTYIAK
ncbi:prephenate dehydrogenase [Bacillus carboniphilus]